MLSLILDMDIPVVDVSPQSVTEGQDLTFTCNVNTNVNPSIYAWYYNGTQISGESNKIYSLTNGSRTNSGKYSCNVEFQSFNKRSQEIVVEYLCKYTFVFVKILGIAVAGILEFLELFLIFLLLEFYLKCCVSLS